MSQYNCIVVLGPTASGKTRLACRLAAELNGEIISADSRQVYKGLNIGAGKDYKEYRVGGKKIPYHLIDVRDPLETFYLHDFIRECRVAFDDIRRRKKMPVICGGTGLYLDSLHKDFSLTQIPENILLREELQTLGREQLIQKLGTFPSELTSHADLSSTKRLIRAIEVADFLQKNPGYLKEEDKPYHPLYVGIDISVEDRRKRILKRLDERFEQGLVEEVELLLKKGVTHERLQFFGLEYKFISLHLQGKLSFSEMKEQLYVAICQYSKRQMTWFRKMEKEGIQIHWIEKTSDHRDVFRWLRSQLES